MALVNTFSNPFSFCTAGLGSDSENPQIQESQGNAGQAFTGSTLKNMVGARVEDQRLEKALEGSIFQAGEQRNEFLGKF